MYLAVNLFLDAKCFTEKIAGFVGAVLRDQGATKNGECRCGFGMIFAVPGTSYLESFAIELSASG